MKPNFNKNMKKIKIAVKRPATSKDDQKYAPRPSRGGLWVPKRPTVIIEPSIHVAVFGPVELLKVFRLIKVPQLDESS